MAKRLATSAQKYWTEAEARHVLADWKASGLTAAAFARLRGLRARRLQWWTERLAESGHGAHRDDATVRFVPAVVRPNVLRATAAAITVRVGKMAAMEIADPKVVPARWVAELMTELERLACS
jgi:hypothetical protein